LCVSIYLRKATVHHHDSAIGCDGCPRSLGAAVIPAPCWATRDDLVLVCEDEVIDRGREEVSGRVVRVGVELGGERHHVSVAPEAPLQEDAVGLADGVVAQLPRDAGAIIRHLQRE
jgi:hypothetical protein